MKKLLRYLKHQLLIALLYLFVAKLSLLVPVSQFYVLPIWPVAGIAFAVIYFYGYTYLPALCIAAFTIAFSTGLPVDVAAAIGVGNTCEAILAVWILRKFVGESKEDEEVEIFGTIRGVVTFVAAAGVACFITASIGTAALFFNQNFFTDEVLSTLYKWFAADFLGVLLVAPCVISWMRSETPEAQKRWVEKLVVFGGLMITTVLMVGIFRSYYHFILIFLVWFSLRFSRRFVMFSSFSVGVIVFGGFVVHFAYAGGVDFQEMFRVQTFIAVAQLITLTIHSLMSEKKRLFLKL